MNIYYWPVWLIVLLRRFGRRQQPLVPNFIAFDQECRRLKDALPENGGGAGYRLARWLILRKISQEQRAADILRRAGLGTIIVVEK